MRHDVSWMLELDIQAGREADFRSLMAEMVEATEANEQGTLSYEWSTSADEKQCHIYERYADSAAALIHLGTFGERFAERFLDVLTPVRLVFYGAPTPELKEAMDGFNAVYMEHAEGFTR